MGSNVNFGIKANVDITVAIEPHCKNGNDVPAASLEVSTDMVTWSAFSMDGTKVTVLNGTSLYFRPGSDAGNVDGLSSGEGAYRSFTIGALGEDDDISLRLTERCDLSGNIMSLIYRDFSDKTTISAPYCFYGLFNECYAVETLPNLAATSISPYCYARMFNECINLKSPPDLSHVTSISEHCCEGMFRGCSKMEGVASLPNADVVSCECCYRGMFFGCDLSSFSWDSFGTEMSAFCFSSMFRGCRKLTVPDGFGFGNVKKLADMCFEAMFAETGLLATPEMPDSSVELGSSCYARMFFSCTLMDYANLTLPAVMTRACCKDMFMECSSLRDVNETMFDSVTQLAEECYYGMFTKCTSLGRCPIPHGVMMERSCYENMFELSGISRLIVRGGSSTSTAKETPPNLADSCFSGMFMGCKKLTVCDIGISSVTELSRGCFRRMFSDCTALVNMPDMPSEAVQLKEGCYESMFSGCTALKSINSGFVIRGTMAKRCCKDMMSGCASLSMERGLFAGDIVCADECFSGMFSGCAGLRYTPPMSLSSVAYKCCEDMFRVCNGIGSTGDITTTKDLKMSDGSGSGRFFYGMFRDCINLKTIGKLPFDAAYIIGGVAEPDVDVEQDSSGSSSGSDSGQGELMKCVDECMAFMFCGCEGLEAYPNDIPAPESASGGPEPELGERCFDHMFAGCTSLVSSPRVLAKNPGRESFRCMFAGCTSLNSVGEIKAFSPSGRIGFAGCYGMFYKCGELTSAPEISTGRSIGDYGVAYMFGDCVKIADAKIMSSPTLGVQSLAYMFSGCSELKSISLAFMEDPKDSGIYSNWVTGSKDGVLYIYDGSTVSSMVPSGWTTSLIGGEDVDDGEASA